MDDVRTIDRDELQQKLARHDDFKLVMALSEWQFEHKRIPGSIRFDSDEAMLAGLGKDDDIVVYCSQLDCKSSIKAYHTLVDHGFTRVRRYGPGLFDWEGAGLPLEGSWTSG
jgi:rhodanese-related sulfurtransferase